MVLFVGFASSAGAQQGSIGVSFAAAKPAGSLDRAFGIGSSMEVFGVRRTRYNPVSVRVGLGYTWLPASTTWHLAATSVEPTIGYTLESVGLAPSVFAGPGWYSVAEKATQNVTVNGVQTDPHSFRNSAFGTVVGVGFEPTLRGVHFPIAFKHHSVPGFIVGNGDVMKFNTFSLGVSF